VRTKTKGRRVQTCAIEALEVHAHWRRVATGGVRIGEDLVALRVDAW
jgi:hypothetical protein